MCKMRFPERNPKCKINKFKCTKINYHMCQTVESIIAILDLNYLTQTHISAKCTPIKAKPRHDSNHRHILSSSFPPSATVVTTEEMDRQQQSSPDGKKVQSGSLLSSPPFMTHIPSIVSSQRVSPTGPGCRCNAAAKIQSGICCCCCGCREMAPAGPRAAWDLALLGRFGSHFWKAVVVVELGVGMCEDVCGAVWKDVTQTIMTPGKRRVDLNQKLAVSLKYKCKLQIWECESYCIVEISFVEDVPYFPDCKPH